MGFKKVRIFYICKGFFWRSVASLVLVLLYCTIGVFFQKSVFFQGLIPITILLLVSAYSIFNIISYSKPYVIITTDFIQVHGFRVMMDKITMMDNQAKTYFTIYYDGKQPHLKNGARAKVQIFWNRLTVADQQELRELLNDIMYERAANQERNAEIS